MTNTEIILHKATDFMMKAHCGQFRKDGITPYFVHPLRVSALLSRHGANHNAILCGLWHDVLEDHPDTRGDLVSELMTYNIDCDERIIGYLEALCKPDLKEGNRAERNVMFCNKVIYGGDIPIFVKICDRIDNVLDSKGLGDLSEKYVVEETGYLIEKFSKLGHGRIWASALLTLIDARWEIMSRNGWIECQMK